MRFFNVVDLANLLIKEQIAGHPGQMVYRLSQVDAVILDELGYMPFPKSGGALLFHLISQLYEKDQSYCHHQFKFWGVGSGIW